MSTDCVRTTNSQQSVHEKLYRGKSLHSQFTRVFRYYTMQWKRNVNIFVNSENQCNFAVTVHGHKCVAMARMSTMTLWCFWWYVMTIPILLSLSRLDLFKKGKGVLPQVTASCSITADQTLYQTAGAPLISKLIFEKATVLDNLLPVTVFWRRNLSIHYCETLDFDLLSLNFIKTFLLKRLTFCSRGTGPVFIIQ